MIVDRFSTGRQAANTMMDKRQHLPSVDKVAGALSELPEAKAYSHRQRVEAARSVLQEARSRMSESKAPSLEEVVSVVLGVLSRAVRAGIGRVVNGTGIILHTGLGRAPLASAAMEAVRRLDGFCNLQVDLESGERGRREGVIESLLQRVTGAEAATAVNNNAGATLLVLAALCKDKEVVVSRGQLVEIGGSFRLPDVIAQSGARMVEVGTTNKTHLRDYVQAITDQTAVLLRVNQSNYRMVGFTKQVSIAELATLKEGRDLVLVDDLGCGALVDLSEAGLSKEPTVQESLAAGADVALFSGDKLIGGPQSGIIIGKKVYLDRIRKHPLMRALRVGKFTVAALEATLKLFLNMENVWETNPTLRLLKVPYGELKGRAERLSVRLSPYVTCRVLDGESACGGGAMPDTPIGTALLAMEREGMSAAGFALRLRTGNPPVIPRVQNDVVLIDVRTLLEGDDERLEMALRKLSMTSSAPA